MAELLRRVYQDKQWAKLPRFSEKPMNVDEEDLAEAEVDSEEAEGAYCYYIDEKG